MSSLADRERRCTSGGASSWGPSSEASGVRAPRRNILRKPRKKRRFFGSDPEKQHQLVEKVDIRYEIRQCKKDQLDQKTSDQKKQKKKYTICHSCFFSFINKRNYLFNERLFYKSQFTTNSFIVMV